MWVIIIGFGLAWGLSLTKFVNLKSLIVSDSKQNSILGFALLASLIITQILFHKNNVMCFNYEDRQNKY